MVGQYDCTFAEIAHELGYSDQVWVAVLEGASIAGPGGRFRERCVAV